MYYTWNAHTHTHTWNECGLLSCYISHIVVDILEIPVDTTNCISFRMKCGLWYLPCSISRLWHPTLSRVMDTRNLTFNMVLYQTSLLNNLSLFPPCPVRLYLLIRLACNTWINLSWYDWIHYISVQNAGSWERSIKPSITKRRGYVTDPKSPTTGVVW